MPTLKRADLEALAARVPTAQRLAVDPLGFVPRPASPEVQEIAAFFAAGLAMGNVKAIGQSVARVVAHLDDPGALGFAGHRWVRGPDIVAVVDRLRDLQARWGSLGHLFANGLDDDGIRGALTRFSLTVREGLPPTRGVRSLTVSPADGSACKRLNLYLRWMVRSDEVDLGLWPRVPPAALRMPLDVHVLRFARDRGLSRRKTVNWAMTEEITARFARLCPKDPLRWDFAISHAGMMGLF